MAEEVKTAPKAAPAAPAAPAEAKNCATCKKLVKKRRSYYRNGIYYCSKNCWRNSKTAGEGATAEGA